MGEQRGEQRRVEACSRPLVRRWSCDAVPHKVLGILGVTQQAARRRAAARAAARAAHSPRRWCGPDSTCRPFSAGVLRSPASSLSLLPLSAVKDLGCATHPPALSDHQTASARSHMSLANAPTRRQRQNLPPGCSTEWSRGVMGLRSSEYRWFRNGQMPL